MNSEIKRLQNEIKQLRKQNLEKQKQIKYYPLNIISNNLYINNSLNEKAPSTKYSNNNRYNSFIKKNKNQNLNNSSLSLKLQKNKNKSYGKLPIKKGIFSYKNSLISSTPNNIFRNSINNNNGSKRLNYKYNNNNSLLSANLKLNLDNNDDNNISQNIVQGRISSASSLDLNKYKITDKSLMKLNRSQRNISVGNISNKNTFKKNSYNNSNNNSNIYSKNTYKNNNNNIIINNIKNNTNNKINTNPIDGITISPIIPKIISTKDQNSPSIFIRDDYKVNNNEISGKSNNSKRKIIDHFKNSSKNEKESRRMIIEYIKILYKQINKNNKKEDVREIMTKNNISKRVLNKEITIKEFNSSKLFNNSAIVLNNKGSGKTSLNNSLTNNFNNSVININNNVLSTKFYSPIKNNINNFMINMNDAKKDKINMVNFLSIPKIMNLFFLDKKYKCICFISPNNISYIKGIESYIFKILDKKTYKVFGGFDLIKVNICSINIKKPENFFIETNDGNTTRNYEFETNSKDISNYYVKSIIYLSQLEKCKIYNNKNIFYNE